MSHRAALPPILYFGNDWSADNRTSSHHVARHLAKCTRLLYIECPGLRPPAASSRDLRRAVEKLWRGVRGARRADDGVLVATLLQVPFRRWRFVSCVNRWLAKATLRRLVRRHGMTGAIAWAVVPHVENIAGRSGEQLLVYYCIDDYAALPGVDEAAVAEMDGTLTRRSDLVFVASATLLEQKRAQNPATLLSPHGVDFEHFARAHDREFPVAGELAGIDGPVVGCFALVERWIDVELVGDLARRLPHATIVMIGRIAVPASTLPSAPNLRWLGARPYESLPSYGRRFDVAIIPYRLTRQVMHANPVKLREYLAMGKPIVAVSTPEIERFADVVSIARRPGEFPELVQAALDAGADDSAIAQRMNVARGMSWSARVAAVVDAVEARLSRQSAGAKAGAQR